MEHTHGTNCCLRYRRLNNEQKKRFKWGGQLKYSGNHTIITRLLKRLAFCTYQYFEIKENNILWIEIKTDLIFKFV